jgi:hypothetical protein
MMIIIVAQFVIQVIINLTPHRANIVILIVLLVSINLPTAPPAIHLQLLFIF